MAFIEYHNMGQLCEFELPQDQEVLFGRSQHADFELQDVAVSRRHFTVKKNESGKYVIKDLGSHNGTMVNNIVLHNEDLVLNNGDEIKLTNYSFHFVNNSNQSEPTTKAESLAAHDVNNTAGFDDITAAFSCPVTDTMRARALKSLEESATEGQVWSDAIRKYAEKLADSSGHFQCSYKEFARECDSFPATGKVVAEKLMANDVIAFVGKELLLSSERYPSGAPRKLEVLIWKLI